MNFLPDVYVPCEVCKGKRYNRETLEVRYKGKNIHEVLEMTVEEAMPAFKKVFGKKIRKDLLSFFVFINSSIILFISSSFFTSIKFSFISSLLLQI